MALVRPAENSPTAKTYLAAGPSYVGGSLRVGNFSEQVWGDSDERDHPWPGHIARPSRAADEFRHWIPCGTTRAAPALSPTRSRSFR